jgi:predicted metal-dependent hydrolase
MDFPPYTFIPGRTPHPVRDPAGHLFGRTPQPPPPLDQAHWQDSQAYLHGVDLFNHGYYWEAHEVWEGLWSVAGRTGATADFLKGLIKLAAAGVKVRQGQPRGITDHARGAAIEFRNVARQLGDEDTAFLGLRLHDLLACTEQIERQAATVLDEEDNSVKVVFDFVLRPAAAER